MSSTTEKTKQRTILALTSKDKDFNFIKKHLGAEGFSVIRAENCDAAYEITCRENVDLLMIDVAGQKEATETLCGLLHGRNETASIPVIAITSPSESGKKGQVTVEAGADDFLGRPLQMPALMVRTKMLLRLKDLHEDVRKRNAELENVNQELASRNKELEQGIEMAHRLQQALLPQHYPRVKNVSFYHVYDPADAIGGDIFQIAPLPENKVAVFLSDVSGHGVRSALVTSILKAVFEQVKLEEKNAGQILSEVNTRFKSIMGRLAPHIYATAFVMIVDGETRDVALASAGHVCPFLISKSNMSCAETISAEKVGPALGFFQKASYGQQEITLSKDDIILGFTDGIFEVTNENKEMYGLDRLKELIEHSTHMVPRDLIERILRDTDDFRRTRKRPDDVCVVAVEVH